MNNPRVSFKYTQMRQLAQFIASLAQSNQSFSIEQDDHSIDVIIRDV